MPHCRFQQNIHRHATHVVVHIELFAHFTLHLLHHTPAVPIECAHETFQHVLMEGGRNQFAMRSPLVALAYQQTVAKPRLKEFIFGRFSQMLFAVQYQFDVPGVGEEDEHFVSEKSSAHVTVHTAQAQCLQIDF